MTIETDFSNSAQAVGKPDPFAKNRRLAVATLGDLEQKREAKTGDGLKVWGDWTKLEGFPAGKDHAPLDRFNFINAILENALAPQKHPTRNYTRPDLNGGRPWLLHKVLVRLIEVVQLEAMGEQPGLNETRIKEIQLRLSALTWNSARLPEDLPKIADDMELLRKHQRKLPAGPERTLQHYKTVEELSKTVKPWRQKHPITQEEQDAADAQFLHKRRGGAKLIATLPDGSRVIQPLSERASRAYGSPRWCTAYRDKKTAFKEYKDDLLILISPEGERWQLHLRTRQFRDDDDASIKSMPTFLREHPGLGDVLAAIPKREIDKALDTALKDPAVASRVEAERKGAQPDYSSISCYSLTADIKDALQTVEFISEWGSQIPSNLVPVDKFNTYIGVNPRALRSFMGDMKPQRFMTAEVISAALKKMPKLLDEISGAPAWHPLVTKDALNDVIKRFPEYLSTIALVQEWHPFMTKDVLNEIVEHSPQRLSMLMEVQEWRAHLTEETVRSGFVALAATKEVNLENIMRGLEKCPEWRATLNKPEGIVAMVRAAMTQSTEYNHNVDFLFKQAQYDQGWAQTMAGPEGLPSLLRTAATESPEHLATIIHACWHDSRGWGTALAQSEALPEAIRIVAQNIRTVAESQNPDIHRAAAYARFYRYLGENKEFLAASRVLLEGNEIPEVHSDIERNILPGEKRPWNYANPLAYLLAPAA